MDTAKTIDPKYRWRLTDIYETDGAWEADFAALKTLIEGALPALRGVLAGGAANLLRVLTQIDAAEKLFVSLNTYATMKRDENTRDPLYQGMADRVTTLAADFMTAVSFLSPEIQALEAAALDGFFAQEAGLAPYARPVARIRALAPHTLDEKGERLLSMASDALTGPETAYMLLTDADMRFPSVTDDKGERVEVTQGNFVPLLENKNRRVRRETFEAYYGVYKDHTSAMGALYAANVKGHLFDAKARSYDGARAAALFPNEVPEHVYDSLIEAVHEALPLMHRYVELRRRALKLDELNFYDLYTPMADGFDIKLSYDEGYAMVKEALAPLGAQYAGLLDAARGGGWIDVYETPGKRAGGYMCGVYGVHPYILLNYHDTLDSVFTLAHELGHAMHSYLSDQTQPYATHDYPIFLAEIASTLNEALFYEYLINKYTERGAQLYLLSERMHSYRSTLFRQTMFAEFEHATHLMAQRGEALTGESLSGAYRELNRLYYGPGIRMDDLIALEWARIPHFYLNFYVFQYSTGFAAANALARTVLDEGAPAVGRVMGLLSAGGAYKPLETLKMAGVDLSTAAPVRLAMEGFKDALDRFEALL